MNLGVVVGRFQSPYLHSGHKALLKHVLDKHEYVLVLVGNSPLLSTKKNPLTINQVGEMLFEYSPRFIVRSLDDKKGDEEWSSLVDKKIGVDGSIIYGGRDSFIPYYSGKYKTVELDFNIDESATELREAVVEPLSREGRVGTIFGAKNRYSNAVPCVDIACFKGVNILLGRKSGEEKWRLPGGFVDPGETWEDAAKRELMEETSIVGYDMVYHSSFVVDDWRYKGEEEKITTSLMTCEYKGGLLKASDDLEEAKFFNIGELPSIVKGHIPLINSLLGGSAIVT